jgi:hypothetical protein
MTEASEELTDLIFERGTLVDLHIGRPGFQRKLKADDLLIEGVDQDALYLGHKKLLPKKATETLQGLDNRARVALADRSLPFPISGARFVKRETLPVLLGILQQMKRVWDEEVQKLVDAYPLLKEQQLNRLNEQAQTLVDKELEKYTGELRVQKQRYYELWLEKQRHQNKELYPHEREIGGHFKFVWRMFRVTGVGVNEMDDVAQTEYVAAQEQLRRDLQLWVRDATTEMHRTLGAAALNAKQLLEKNGKLDPRNLRPLFAAFESFQAVEFTGSSSFQRTIEEIRSRFAHTLDGEIDLNLTAFSLTESADSRGAFTELLGSVARLAEEDVARQAGIRALSGAGEFARVLDV